MSRTDKGSRARLLGVREGGGPVRVAHRRHAGRARVGGKSILGVMMLARAQAEITLRAEVGRSQALAAGEGRERQVRRNDDHISGIAASPGIGIGPVRAPSRRDRVRDMHIPPTRSGQSRRRFRAAIGQAGAGGGGPAQDRARDWRGAGRSSIHGCDPRGPRGHSTDPRLDRRAGVRPVATGKSGRCGRGSRGVGRRVLQRPRARHP